MKNWPDDELPLKGAIVTQTHLFPPWSPDKPSECLSDLQLYSSQRSSWPSFSGALHIGGQQPNKQKQAIKINVADVVWTVFCCFFLFLTCAVGLSRVRGETHYFQTGELGHHVVFPGDDEGRRTQVNFVHHQHHVLLQVPCDVTVQGGRELQDLEKDKQSL